MTGEWQSKVVAEFVDILDRHSVLAAAEGSQALVNMVCGCAFNTCEEMRFWIEQFWVNINTSSISSVVIQNGKEG